MLRLFLYFGLISTIFCASLELDVANPESLEKASDEEILSLNELLSTKPTAKWKNSPIILRTLQLTKSIITQNMEQQVHMTYILSHLIKIIENNTESFSVEEQDAMNKLIDAMENYKGPTLEHNRNPGLRRKEKMSPKGITRTKNSYCADVLLKISQIASDAYNKLTSQNLDEDSKLSNVFEILALPVAGIGEISPYVKYKQPSKDALNFFGKLDPRKTMNEHDSKYSSTEIHGKGINMQRNVSPIKISKSIDPIKLYFKRPRNGYSYGTKKLSQPLYKHLKSYDRTTRTSVNTKDPTENLKYGLPKLYNMKKEVTPQKIDDYPFNFDEFENFEGWESDDSIVPLSGNYYAWESSPTLPNYFYSDKNVYDSNKKIPMFPRNILANTDFANPVANPDFKYILNKHQLDGIHHDSNPAQQYYTKPPKHHFLVSADSLKNNHQPIDNERPWGYYIPYETYSYDNLIPSKHYQFDENDKSQSVVAPQLHPIADNRQAYGHVSNLNPFTNRHKGYISIEDLKGPDNHKFWAYDTHLWNMGMELPEVNYDVPVNEVEELSYYQPKPTQDVEFINAFPVNLGTPRADFLNYSQVNNPENWPYDVPVVDNSSEIEVTTERVAINQTETNQDYFQTYVQNPDPHLPSYQTQLDYIKEDSEKKSIDNRDSIQSHKWLPIPADRLVVVSEYVEQKPKYYGPYNQNPSEIDITTKKYTLNDLWHFNKKPDSQHFSYQYPDYHQPSYHKPINNYWPYDQPYYTTETEIELTTKRYDSVDFNPNRDWLYNQHSDYYWPKDHNLGYYRPYDENPSNFQTDLNTNNIDSSPSYNVLPKSTVRPMLIDQSPSHYWSFDQEPSELNIDDSTERFILPFSSNDELLLPIKISKDQVNHNSEHWPYHQNPSELASYDSGNYWIYYQNPDNYWIPEQNPSDIGIFNHQTEPNPSDIKWIYPKNRPFDHDWSYHQNTNYDWQNDQNPDYNWPYDNNPSEIEIDTTTISSINYDVNSNPAYNMSPLSIVRPFSIKHPNKYWPNNPRPDKYYQDPSDIPYPIKNQNPDYDWLLHSNPNYKWFNDYNPNFNWSYDHSSDYTYGKDPEYDDHIPEYFGPYDQNTLELNIEVTTKPHFPNDQIMATNIDYYRPNYLNPNINWLYIQNPHDSAVEITTKSHKENYIDSGPMKNWYSVNKIRPFDPDQNLDYYWPHDQNPSHSWPTDLNPSQIEVTTKGYIPINYNIDKYPSYNELVLPPNWPFQIKNYSDQTPDKNWPSKLNPNSWPVIQNPSEMEGKDISLYHNDQNSKFNWPNKPNSPQFQIAYNPFYDENAHDFIPYQPEKLIQMNSQKDPEQSWNKPIEVTTQDKVISTELNPLAFDYLVPTKRPSVLINNGHNTNNFINDHYAWNLNKPSTKNVPILNYDNPYQDWNSDLNQWDFNIKVPTMTPTMNSKVSGNTAFIWNYNQYPETETYRPIVSNENEYLNHNYNGMYNVNWNQPYQISTEGYITIDGISVPQINHLWTSEHFWEPEYDDLYDESLNPEFQITTKSPKTQDNSPYAYPYNLDNEYEFSGSTATPVATVTDFNTYPWENSIQITTKIPVLEYEISEFENSYPKEVTNEIIIATEVTSPRPSDAIDDLNYIYDPNINTDYESGMSIEETSSNMMPFGDISINNESTNLDYSADLVNKPSWNYDNNGNSSDFIEVPNYDDDYSDIFSTDLSDLEIDDNIETETEVINLIKQKLNEVEKIAQKQNEISILTLINKIREITKGEINKDKYIEVLTYYNEINSYLNANMNGQSKMTMIINRLYTLPNQKNLELDTHDHFVEMTYLVRRPKPIIIYPYYYIKYRVPVHKIDELVREDPNIIDEDDNLHIDLLQTSEVSDRSFALKNLSEHDLHSLTIGHGDVIDTKLVSVSSNKTADLFKDLFYKHHKQRSGEKTRTNLNDLNGKAIQLTIKQNANPYDTISIAGRHFPIEEHNGDQLNDLNDPFRKLLSLYKLKEATNSFPFKSRRGFNVDPLNILPDYNETLTLEPLNHVVNIDKKAIVTEENNTSTENVAHNSSINNSEHNSINTNYSLDLKKNEEMDSAITENNALRSNTMKNVERNSVNMENDAVNSDNTKNEEHNSVNTIHDALNSSVENVENSSINTNNDALPSNTIKNEEHNSIDTERYEFNSKNTRNEVINSTADRESYDVPSDVLIEKNRNLSA